MKLPRLIFTLLFAAGVVDAQPDAAVLVKQSIANHQRDWMEGAHWRYKQTDTTWTGEEKQVEVSEVVPLFNTPYERLTAKNGQALSPDEQKKEERKYEKAFAARQNESPAERASRMKKYEEEWSFLQDVPNAYDFAVSGEEVLNGRPTLVLSMTRRPDFVAGTSRGSMLKHIDGKLWIDKQDVQWVKAEAHVIDTISIGWFVARIGPGAEIKLSMVRVADGLWMPGTIEVNGSAKVLMVHRKNLDETVAFSDYSRVGPGQATQVSGNSAARGLRP